MMFSSLPSASKIYISSAKPRQKNMNSAKRKRRKLVTSASTPVRSNPEEETLVSSTNIRKSSLCQISGNDYEESFELSTADEDSTLCTSLISGKEHITDTEANCFSGETINELHLKTKSCQIISDDIKHIVVVNDSKENEKSNTFEKQEFDDNLQTSIDLFVNEECNDTIDFLSKTTLSENNLLTNCVLESNQISEVTSNNEDSDKKVDECLQGENLSNPVISISISEITPNNNLTNETTISNPDIENDCDNLIIESSVHCESTQTDLDSTLLTLAETSLTYEKHDILPESSALISNKNKNLLGDNLNSDHCDSSSVRSDCCISTNIYHDHIDNSEHNSEHSLDENEVSSVECVIKSPSQSEISCTESTIHNDKSVCQSESVSNSNSTLERDAVRKISPAFHQDILIYSDNFTKNSSHSVIDLQKIQPSEILRRTVSLPEHYSKFTILKTFNHDVSNIENVLSPNKNNLCNSKIMFDKYTSTSDFRTISTDKATLTSEDYYYPNYKKDASTTPIKQEQFISENEKLSVLTSFKENSMLIMKVLPPIAMMQARARSYVFGRVNSTGSLLGSEELSRFFPDNKVTVFVGTWNMNGHDTPESIDDFLLPLDVSYMPDIYAIGVQESMQSRSEWEIALQTTLGPSHVLFASTSFGVLHLSIFMRRDLIWFCSEPEEASIATRPGSMIKTKGAVAICFMFFGTSFLFVNSHLTAHEQKLKERLSDYEKICSSLDLPKQIPLKSHLKNNDVTSRFDCVFWCGDLNFRVMHDRPSVISFVEEKIRQTEPSCNMLMKHDQLSQAMAKGTAFNGFNEGMINFIPSYKFNVGTNSFDSTKLRVPSYTDRILYRSKDKSSIDCLHYDAVPEISTSDHKPVYAIFNVSLKPGRDNIPLAAGLFKRDIYLEAIKRRACQFEVARNHKQSTVCSVM